MLQEHPTPLTHFPQVKNTENFGQPEEPFFHEAIRQDDFVPPEVLNRLPSSEPSSPPAPEKPDLLDERRDLPEKIAEQIASGGNPIIRQARWILSELHRTLPQDDFVALLERVLDLLRRDKVQGAFKKLKRAVPETARRHLEQFRDNRPPYIPTPEEIRAACAEIQAGWSEQDRLKRAFALPATCTERFALFLQCPRCCELYEAKATCRGCPTCRQSGVDRDKKVFRRRKAVAK